MLRTGFWGGQRQYWSLRSGKQYYYIHSRTCKYLPYSVSLKVLAFLLLSPIYFQDVSLIRKNCTGQERLREFEVRPLLFAVGSDEAENQVQPTPSSPLQLSLLYPDWNSPEFQMKSGWRLRSHKSDFYVHICMIHRLTYCILIQDVFKNIYNTHAYKYQNL